jgi:hypothetical protein
MKQTLSVGTVATVVVLLVGVGGIFNGAESNAPCTVKTLRGTYIFRDLWVNWQPNGSGQSVNSGTGTLGFDGDGRLTASGSVRRIDQFGHFTLQGPFTDTGTYTVGGDCIATITLDTVPLGIEAVVTSDGSAFVQFDTTTGLNNNENMLGIGLKVQK